VKSKRAEGPRNKHGPRKDHRRKELQHYGSTSRQNGNLKSSRECRRTWGGRRGRLDKTQKDRLAHTAERESTYWLKTSTSSIGKRDIKASRAIQEKEDPGVKVDMMIKLSGFSDLPKGGST